MESLQELFFKILGYGLFIAIILGLWLLNRRGEISFQY